MARDNGAASLLAEALGIVLGTAEIPLRLSAWDGSEAGPAGAPVLEFRSRRALRRILWSPGQLGLSRAYVAGDIDAPGDIFASFAALSSAGKFAEPGPFRAPTAARTGHDPKNAVRLGALGPNPAPPPEEARVARDGRRHTRRAGRCGHLAPLRRRQRLLRPRPGPVHGLLLRGLGRTKDNTGLRLDRRRRPNSTWSAGSWGCNRACGCWTSGCGWGSFALHAAQHYGVDVVGVTLSARTGGAWPASGWPTPA